MLNNILMSVVIGVVAALACVGVMRLIGVDVSPAVVGGVSGGLAAVLPQAILRQSKS